MWSLRHPLAYFPLCAGDWGRGGPPVPPSHGCRGVGDYTPCDKWVQMQGADCLPQVPAPVSPAHPGPHGTPLGGLRPLKHPRDCSWASTALPCSGHRLRPPCMPTAWWMPPHRRGARPLLRILATPRVPSPQALSCPGSEAQYGSREGSPSGGWGRKNRPPEA